MGSDALVVVVDGPSGAAASARRHIEHLERHWSRFLDDSDISRLNAAAGCAVSVHADTAHLVLTAVRAWRLTAGLFDPTLLDEVIAAGYRHGIPAAASGGAAAGGVPAAPAGPAGAAYASAPRRIERGGAAADPAARIAVDASTATIRLPVGASFDPGGIGKGLAADLVVEALRRRGAAGALVDVGGDLRVSGTPPSGAVWPIGVEDPFDTERDLALLRLRDEGVATSGPRFKPLVDADGRAGHHLIDPATGRPAAAPPASSTVVSPSAAWAEAFATALAVGGRRGRDLVAEAGCAGLLVRGPGAPGRAGAEPVGNLARYLA